MVALFWRYIIYSLSSQGVFFSILIVMALSKGSGFKNIEEANCGFPILNRFPGVSLYKATSYEYYVSVVFKPVSKKVVSSNPAIESIFVNRIPYASSER